MNAPDPDPAQLRDLSRDERCALMSALVDGDASALQGACTLWRDDAEARAAWHTYHLIGDVLRSDDLAAAAPRDAAFLAGLRERLAAEPVVLAPEPVVPVLAAAGMRRQRSRLAATALAAGFVAFAGVLVVTRVAGPAAQAPVVAAVPAAPAGFIQASNAGDEAAQPLVVEGRLIRDARLDSYLRAHREALGGFPVAVPGGMPRSIETVAPAMPVSATVQR